MGNIYRNKKLVGYEASPDDPLEEVTDIAESNNCGKSAKKNQDSIEDEKCSDNTFHNLEDRLKYPSKGHIPGSKFARDGKVVTNPGLRDTGFTPSDE